VSDSTTARTLSVNQAQEFTRWSQKGLKDFSAFTDNGSMDEHRARTTTSPTCDEVRSTRLHYRLRCLLRPGHDGDHRWTPELVPVGAEGDEAATG
jgi:hypothetical protein